MRWNSRAAAYALAGAMALGLLPLRSAEEKRMTIYAQQANYSLPVVERATADYIALFEAVEPLGQASAKLDGNTWRLHFNDLDCEFKKGATRAKIGRTKLQMTAPFLVEGGRGYIPLQALPMVLSRLLNVRVDFHPASRRIFVNGVATRFTLELKKGEGLEFKFSDAVNPMISTEPGKLKMTFTREPVVSGEGSFQFQDDKLISAAKFNEVNGTAELLIQANAPVMASFADGGKTIHVAAAPALPQPSANTGPQAGSNATPAPAAAIGPQPPAAPTPGVPPPFVVVLDATHGGDERGAALSEKTVEKDVTLAFTRKLRGELQAKGINTLMLRDSDSTVSLEQRAETANIAKAAMYIGLHASNIGTGVRVYTAMLPTLGGNPQVFLPWETAQTARLAASRALAKFISDEVSKRELSTSITSAPIRPLNNLVIAAVALEVSPATADVESLTSANYEQFVASAIATGIINAKSKLFPNEPNAATQGALR